MIINIEKTKEKVLFKIEGRLDTTTASQLSEKIEEMTKDVKNLILDMAKLEYVSSAGLRVILSAQKLLSKEGSLKLINVCEAVMDVFEITGFADILTIE